MLLFVDNIFRFSQAGSEVSALLGRTPSAVGYQPTLAAEMGNLQGASPPPRRGPSPRFQAVYVPADDLTDPPAPATTFAHLDATIVLERSIAELGIYPAVDPLASNSRALPGHRRRKALQCGARRAEGAAAVQGPLGHHRDPGHGRAFPETSCRVPRPQDQKFLSQPFSVAEVFTAAPASGSRCGDRARLQGDPRGKHDEVGENDFYMKGGIGEIRSEAEGVPVLDS